MNINPEILSNKPTHIYKGIKVKVFSKPNFDNKIFTAEIMEGPNKGKWTQVDIKLLQPIEENKKENKMTMRESYIKKADHLVQEAYEIDDGGDMDVETAKAIISKYLDQCVEEGTKIHGADFGLEDSSQYELTQNRLEEIVGKLQNYLTKGNLPIK